MEEAPALDAADAALDQKMAQEDKPRLIQVSWVSCTPAHSNHRLAPLPLTPASITPMSGSMP